jgi:hypothetical protein
VIQIVVKMAYIFNGCPSKYFQEKFVGKSADGSVLQLGAERGVSSTCSTRELHCVEAVLSLLRIGLSDHFESMSELTIAKEKER